MTMMAAATSSQPAQETSSNMLPSAMTVIPGCTFGTSPDAKQEHTRVFSVPYLQACCKNTRPLNADALLRGLTVMMVLVC